MSVIGLLGWIGSGKGTVSDFLVNEYGYVKLSWADSVKDATAAVFRWPRNLLEGDTEESRVFRERACPFWTERFERPFTPREAMQKMGTEAGRNVFSEDLWLFTVEMRMKEYPWNTKFVIPDTRFPNEIAMIHEMGGKVAWVKRGESGLELPPWYDDALRHNMSESTSLMQNKWPKVHESEWAWIGCPYDQTIFNASGIDELKEETRKFKEWFENEVE
jgi:hypothetical protein